MAKIVDPDALAQTTDVVYDRDAKTIQILATGAIDDGNPGRSSGVTGQAIYSFTKEEWRTDATLNVLRFPFDPIFEQKLQLVDGWKWADAQTRDILRDAGWSEIDGSEYAGLQTLGDFNATADQAYYQQVAGFDLTADNSVADFDKTGEVNEAVQVLGAGGSPDYSGFLRVLLREQGKTYAEGELVADQALSAIDFRFYGLPLENATDITDGTGAPESDSNIDSLTPYTNMTVDYLKGQLFETAAVQSYSLEDVVQDTAGRWAFCTTAGTMDAAGVAAYGSNGGTAVFEAYAGELQIGTSYYAFNRIIDGATGTAKEIYEWAQRQLRKTTDINDDTLGSPNQNGHGAYYGRIAKELCYFIGDVLHSAPGTALTNFDTNYTNNVRQHDITVDNGLDTDGLPVVSTERQYPFVAAGNLVFSQNLVDEPDAKTLYKMFFQYTKRETNTDVALTSSSGDNTTMTSTLIDLSQWASGDFMYVQGFTTNPTNNGMYEATGTPAANSIDLIKVDGIDPIDETAGDSVSLDLDPFDSPDAIVVDDDGGTDITGQITAGTIAFDFDYTNNNQGGRTADTDADVAVIAMGEAGARWVVGLFTITKTTGLNFPVNAADELVYST